MASERTQTEWAKIYGVSQRTISNWKKSQKESGGCPPFEDVEGVFVYNARKPKNRANPRPIKEVKKELGIKLKEEAEAAPEKNVAPYGTKEYWEVEGKILDASKKTLELELLQGSVVKRADSTAWTIGLISQERDGWEDRFEDIASLCDGKKAIQILKTLREEMEKVTRGTDAELAK